MNALHPTYEADLKLAFGVVEAAAWAYGKTFFITGGSGLVGSCLVDALMMLNTEAAAGIHIYATFTAEKSYTARFGQYVGHPCFHPIIQDLCRPVAWGGEADYIVHGASNTHPRLYAADPVGTAKLNIMGTLSMLEIAKRNPACRMLFLSSYEVYGQKADSSPFTEDEVGYLDFNIPRAAYPESKRMSETLCRSAAAVGSAQAMVARLGSIYGPTVKADSSKADVQFLNCVLQGQSIIMKSPGTSPRSWCYVTDTVQGLLRILQNGRSGEAYNVANSHASLSDVAHLLADMAGQSVICENPHEAPRYELTISPARLLALGWAPHFTLQEGLSHTYSIKKDLLS